MFHVRSLCFVCVLSFNVIWFLLIGLDYVVHLANSYLESQGETRLERMSFALLTMGVSVASGAMTTMLCGFVLMFSSILFFSKMGMILFTTVLFALMWALIFFASIALLVGPEGDQGDLKQYLVYCPCKPCKEHDEPKGKEDGVELGTKP